jgi:hypothetical protein
VLGYSSLNELIQTNKAKEAARLMTSFVERSLAESKMRQAPVTITVSSSSIKAEMEITEIINVNVIGNNNETQKPFETSETISNGFSANNNNIPDKCSGITPNEPVTSQPRIGVSGIDGIKCFVVCNGGNYCGAAIKEIGKNNFIAQIKKKNSGWESL